MEFIIALIFVILTILSSIGAYIGHRGWVTNPKMGYSVPDRVRNDPALARKANQSVTTWCLFAAGLALAPAVAVIPAIVSDFYTEISLPFLVVNAIYAALVSSIAWYPFDRISRL